MSGPPATCAVPACPREATWATSTDLLTLALCERHAAQLREAPPERALAALPRASRRRLAEVLAAAGGGR